MKLSLIKRRQFVRNQVMNVLHKFIYIIVFLTSGLSVSGQKKSFYFNHLTTSNNLSQNSVLSMIQDSKGFMWFGTQAGLDKYDGVTFRHFSNLAGDSNTITKGFVNVLFEDKKKGLLWIGTTFGICSINLGNNSQIRQYRFTDNSEGHTVVSITSNLNGKLWFATEASVFTVENDRLLQLSLESNFGSVKGVKDLLADPVSGQLLIAAQNGLWLLDAKTNKIKPSLPPSVGFSSPTQKLFYLPNNSGIVIGLSNKVVLFSIIRNYDQQIDSFQFSRELTWKNNNFGNASIQGSCAITVDQKGNMWIGTSYSGLYVIPPGHNIGNKMTRDFNIDKSLSSTYIRSLYESNDGTVWIGTDGGGLNFYSPNRLIFFKYFTSNFKNPEYVPNNDVWSIVQEDKNTILLGTDGNGILRYSTQTMLPSNYFRSKASNEVNIVRGMVKNGDHIYIGTLNGLYYCPVYDLPNYNKYKIFEDSIYSLLLNNNKLFAGTVRHGVAIFKEDSLRAVVPLPQYPESTPITALTASSQDKIWVGTSSGIFSIAARDNNYLIKEKYLNGYFITAIADRNDTLWVGTKSNGLICTNAKDGRILNHYTDRNGLLDNTIYGIVDDKSGKLWVSTNKGIGTLFLGNNTFNKYSRNYGLQHDEFNIGALSYDVTVNPNVIYFGGVNGFNTFNPNQINGTIKEYDVCLLAYKNEVIHELGQTNNSFKVDPNADFTKFDVRIFSFADPYNNKYKFSLNGSALSDEQSESESLVISRGSLKLWGTNTLIIYTRTSDGSWHKESNFSLDLPFTIYSEYKYSRPWVILSVIVVLLLFIGIGAKVRKDLKREHSEVSKRAAQFETQNTELKELQTLLNEITACQNLDQIVSLAISHLTNSDRFKFAYAIFSKIDLNDNVLIYVDSLARDPYRIDPQRLLSISNPISLDSTDKRVVSIRQNTVVQIANDSNFLEFSDSAARNLIAPDLLRLLIPVAMHGQVIGESQNKGSAVALLEVGLHNFTLKKLNTPLLTMLGIYSNTLALSYHALQRKQRESEAQRILVKCAKESKDDHMAYLSQILESTCQLLKAESGAIVIQSYDWDSAADEKIKLHFPDHDQGIFGYESYSSGELYIRNADDVTEREAKHSVLSMPIKYFGQIVGCFDILSHRNNVFTDDKIELIKNIFAEVGEEYFNKKFHNAVASLVSPDYILNEPFKNIELIIQVLMNYFHSSYISVWMRNYESENEEFIVKASTEKILKIYKENDILKEMFSEHEFPSYTFIKIKPSQPENSFQFIDNLAKSNHLKSFIQVPLRIDSHYYGFIHIYSVRKQEGNLFFEDRQLLELIANRTIILYLASTMVYSFSDITKTLATKKLDRVLEKITYAAREILNSDPVILYRFKKTKGITYKEPVFSGYFLRRDRIIKAQKATFIEDIVNAGVDRIFESESELPISYQQVESSFWKEERIASLAVNVLMHEGQLIGVMCFNYRQKQTFSPYIKQLINTFSALAATAINNLEQVAVINEQRKELQVKAEKIQFEYEEVYQKMQDMLPSAKRSSLLEILRQINHDIINDLLLIKMDLSSLSNNSHEWVRTERDRKGLKENIESVNLNIDRSNNMVKLFNPLSFKETYEYLNIIAASVCKLFEARYRIDDKNSGINIELDFVDMPTIRCSKAEMAMIIYNLISNSEKAIKEKMNLDGNRKEGAYEGVIRIKCYYEAQGKWFNMEVYDNGIGIDKNYIPLIYNPGETSRTFESGIDDFDRVHGIGLYFVKECIENNYQGMIECESYKGNYTKFRLKFKDIIS